jgi:hypothetical protein
LLANNNSNVPTLPRPVNIPSNGIVDISSRPVNVVSDANDQLDSETIAGSHSPLASILLANDNSNMSASPVNIPSTDIVDIPSGPANVVSNMNNGWLDVCQKAWDKVSKEAA